MRPCGYPQALAFAFGSTLAVGAACGESFSSGNVSTHASGGSGGAGTSTSSMGGNGGTAASAGSSSDGGTGATSPGGSGQGAMSTGGYGTGGAVGCVDCATWWSFCDSGPIGRCQQHDPFCTAPDAVAAGAVRACVCVHCSDVCTDLCAIDAGGVRADDCSTCIDGVLNHAQCTAVIGVCAGNG